MQMRRYFSICLTALSLLFLAFAQTHPVAAQGPGRGQAAVISPEIAPDGRVTFRLRSANAKEVTVNGIGAPLPMAKDAQGIWSAMSPSPLAPDIYSYTFSMDGIRGPDPSNQYAAWAVASAARAGSSTLLIPGVPWSTSDVPHGAVARHEYKSTIIGGPEVYYVYTPPGYEAKRSQAYPVVVMLHGLGDTAPDWILQGGANLTLDNLIAGGKATPMILVSPSSYGTPGGATGAAAGFPNFTKALIGEILPQVEKEYNASKKASEHAIGGLSMGAAQSLLALSHTDQFEWISSFSPGFDMYDGMWRAMSGATGASGAGGGRGGGAGGGFGASGGRGGGAFGASGGRGGPLRQRAVLGAGILENIFPTLDARANANIKLLYISCGTADDHLNLTRQFRDFLSSKQIKLTYYEAPDMAHVWPFWRQQFAEFASLLFKPRPR